MTTFIHISDLHIHKSNKDSDNKNAKALVSHIVKNYENQPITILVTGDITDDGSEEQYENALNILNPLVEAKFTVLPAPGNHDYGYKGNVYTEKSQMRFQQYMLAKLINHEEAQKPGNRMEHIYPMLTEIEDTIFIGVDSVVGNENQLLHFASGEVGKPQRKEIDKLLKKYEGTNKNIVVYFHHHPFDRKFGMEMDDAKKVLRMLASRVEMICFGHDHKSEAYNGQSDIDWMLASGKSTKQTPHDKLQFREITLGQNSTAVALISF